MLTFQDRRTFLKSTAAAASLAFLPMVNLGALASPLDGTLRRKKPAIIKGAFFYPPAALVLAGKVEDNWSKHQWFTWPGNQFAPEKQQERFLAQLKRITSSLDIQMAVEPKALYTDAAIANFIGDVQSVKPDALLLFNFWNSFSPKLRPILEAFNGPIILYHPVGANHQLPPEYFRTAPRVQYIHSIENWDALESGLRSVHAMTRMRQSRLLRVSGALKKETDEIDSFFNLPIHGVPAESFNRIFDDTLLTVETRRLARKVRGEARHVTGLAASAFLDAARAHAAVKKMMEVYDADAITIECLFLKHRKPCLSFSINNGNLIPCGCENDLDATLTLMLGAYCLGRGGFQHNPEFDTERNLYFGAHCTCATRLHGPSAKRAKYDLRPFFHQIPETLAMDVQWPPGEIVTLCKYQAAKQTLDAWRGKVVESPACPPTGGCATRVLLEIDGIKDVTGVYSGPHPVLFCGDFARRMKTLTQLYGLTLRGNC